jgi:hypothetical protein
MDKELAQGKVPRGVMRFALSDQKRSRAVFAFSHFGELYPLAEPVPSS